VEPDETGRDDVGGAMEPSVAELPDASVAEGALAILEEVEAELADVEHALKRLDEGTYGICEACGEPIGQAHLDSSPAARLCAHDENPVALRFF
jgi:RNA polymerase-binding transcription factor DksA